MQVDQIPSGYKLTEVGIIPSDWDVVKLGDISTNIGDGIHATPEYVNCSDFYFINGNNLVNGSIKITENTKSISINEFTKHKKELSDRTILLSINGTIGNLAFFNDENVILGKSVAYINVNKSIEKKYIFYFLQSSFIANYFKNELTGSTINNLSLQSIRNTPILFPKSDTEQKRIAQVLSDIDELIRSLDELVIKKRNIKQGTMQLLLTGKQRLPGYSEEWEVKTFDDCFKFLITGSNARSDLSESGEVKYIHYGDIHAKKLPILDCAKDFIPGIARNKVKNLPLLEDGDLIIADASEDYQGLGKSIEIKNVNNCEIVAGLHTLLLRADKLVLADGFKAYITSIESVKNALIKIATGISVFGISKKAIKSIQLFLPPLEEQKAIARILSDMDEEIEVLEQKRNKYQDIKKGMMQELLTGKTRLV
jgi:type I restriction enzyme S subunit